ncbi:hypothetical protein GLOIN_2v1813037 [Rhizophagus clarus]|uniref:CCHC-type domain-containing protein n=1 Tax=Rhizophagus clarus TaxID=94130 RepID=A0A8H3LH36_9GLOM|nr:hypothetical protein GLOIN_2v1813037 [Rhizophagus clarus]
MQKAIQDALAQQKTENQTLIKKITELESQMAKQTHIPTPQTVKPIKPVRQLRGPPAFTKSEEGMRNYHIYEYLKNLGYISQEEMDHDYPVKPFQRPHPQRSNVSARIDRVEEGINETRDAVNQLTNQFQKLDIRKCDTCGETGHSKSSCPKQIARSNFNWGYFKPLTPINFQNTPPDSDNDGDGYDEENNRWPGYDPPEKKTDSASEFCCMNDPAINAFGWKVDKPSDFAIKGNSKHITEALGWFTDVPISIRDKDGKIVTVTGNFTRIDNGEPEPMLCLGMTWIRKVQGVLDPNKNQF